MPMQVSITGIETGLMKNTNSVPTSLGSYFSVPGSYVCNITQFLDLGLQGVAESRIRKGTVLTSY
jgi:hypothetical protein